MKWLERFAEAGTGNNILVVVAAKEGGSDATLFLV